MTEATNGYQLDYLPYLVHELREAGRDDLGQRVELIAQVSRNDPSGFEHAALDAVVQAGLELRLPIAISMAMEHRARRAAREIIALGELPEAPSRIEALISDHIRVRQAQQVLDEWAVSEAQAEYEATVAETAKALEPNSFNVDEVIDYFADLISIKIDVGLRTLASDLDDEGFAELDLRLSELPSEIAGDFDDEREMLASEFQALHGVIPAELYEASSGNLTDQQDYLLDEWERVVSAAARAYLMRIYSTH